MAFLAEHYWRPVYQFFRRWGRSREDAEDLTQAFFAHFIDRGLAGRAGLRKPVHTHMWYENYFNFSCREYRGFCK